MWKNKIWFLICLYLTATNLFELSACSNVPLKELTRYDIGHIIENVFWFFLFGYWSISEMIVIIKKAKEEK